MMELRPFDSLGRFANDWLSARYHFSFAGYHDPARRGVGPLLVWNDDTIQSGRGFDMHGHRDMEIITYVRRGAITHQDHLGNRGRTEAGDVQVMSAGRGIMHAEFNQEAEPTLIYQIWVMPSVAGVAPHWEAKAFPKGDRAGELVALASGRAGDGDALPIHQDAAVLGATLGKGQSVTHRLGRERAAYLVTATGSLRVKDPDGQTVETRSRDGLVVRDVESLTIEALEDSELLLADIPA